ncbi:MAG: putative toxin-antitoxin system toxin component, PIN family [Candidatus Entotheonellia bacterium]
MPTPQIVIDTNILLAGLRSRRGYAFRLLQLVGTERFEINVSVPLVMEYESTLLRELPNLPVSRSVVEEVINFHCAMANRHQIFFLWRPFLRDPKDDMVLELALKAGCDYIVTYNKRDFAGVEKAFQVRVVDAGEFLRAIGA